MSVMTVNLTGDLAAFVEDRVARGYSESAAEAVEHGLRLLKEEQDRKLAALKAAIAEGIADIEAGRISTRSVREIADEVLGRSPR